MPKKIYAQENLRQRKFMSKKIYAQENLRPRKFTPLHLPLPATIKLNYLFM